MATIKIKQTVSINGETKRQKASLRCLGIRKMHQSVVVEKNPVTEGQIAKVAHLVEVEEVK